ncbi:MAG TPA: serine/threonine-protein kinase, partial [Vicinamibacteria bacterium]|nr:serine/threonine-protein kinase [Vicinamibacteria bacterium]
MVQRELAAGALSRILLAEDPLARRPVVIKTLRWESVANENVAFCLARLDRQAQTGGRLAHPHLVKVFDRGSDFLVLEYLQGLSLSTILRDRGRMDVDEALRVLAPLAAALDHMHARGVVHRDVRPANVVVLADGSPKLIDFGASCLMNRPLEAWDRLLGTPAHMAPEQVLHGTASALTDVFSLGVLAYEMITGEAPFRGDSVGSITYRLVYEPAAPPSRKVDGLPRVYDEIFARALAKEPERRLTSAGAFVRALQGGRERCRTPTAEALEEQRRDLASLKLSLPGSDAEGCVVEVKTQPEGAQVLWNGVERGLTPLRICETSPGPHSLTLRHEGYAPVEAAFVIPAA